MKHFILKFTFLFFTLLGLSSGIVAQNTCASPTVIGAIPFSSGAQTTCGTVNDYAAGTLCNASYGGGEDYVYELSITTAPVTYSFALAGSGTWKIMSVHSACPPTSGTCVGSIVTSSGSTGSTNITFSTNGTYYIIIDTWPTPTCGAFTLNITAVVPPPVNDVCSGAITLTPGVTCVPTAGSTSGATDNNETGDCTNGTENAVWYKFVATATSHTVTVDGDAGFDAVIGALVTCGSATRPTGGTCTDNTLDDGVESMSLSGLTIGLTYYIQVHDYEGDNGAGSTFSICVSQPAAAPANDLCAGAVVVTNGSSITIDVTNATDDASAPACSGVSTATKGVWYVYNAPATSSGTVTIDGCNTNYDSRVRVYKGTCAALVCVIGADNDNCAGPGSSLAESTPFTVISDPSPVNYYILFTGAGNNLGFTITSALPIELTTFTGKAMEQSNMLSWTTATEKNVQWHIIERSVNGTDNWTAIGQKSGRGTTQAEQKYDLEDKLPLPKAYYRIHTVDFDGKEQVSNTILITRNDSRFGITAAYPNPASDELNIQFNTSEEATVTVQITDFTGRIVYQQKMDAVKGANLFPVNLGQFSAGSYTVNVVNGNAVGEPVRFVKQ